MEERRRRGGGEEERGGGEEERGVYEPDFMRDESHIGSLGVKKFARLNGSLSHQSIKDDKDHRDEESDS
jgi:hypothetical protein